MNEAYGTHLPVLKAACEHTHGPIIELGVGEASTPHLNRLSNEYRRDVCSFETNYEWFAKFLDYRGPYHYMALVAQYGLVPFDAMFWSVALVDQAPAEDRVRAIAILRYRAQVIVAHDSELKAEKAYRYATIVDQFMYRKDYTKLMPNTLLLSNYIDVSKWEIE